MQISEIQHNGKRYGVFVVMYKTYKIPVVIDAIDIPTIKLISQNCVWRCNISGCISCITRDGIMPTSSQKKIIKLHHIILNTCQNQICTENYSSLLRQLSKMESSCDNSKPESQISRQDKEISLNDSIDKISHLDKLLLDNRRENLFIGSSQKNMRKKKKRIVSLPPDSGISSDDLPSYVWYSRADKTHADRFVVKINDVVWKSTSSRKVSLKYKLEETKYFLRELKIKQPKLFEDISLNGDFTKKGRELLDSFYCIVAKCGYILNKIPCISHTNKYLRHHKLPKSEECIFNTNVVNKSEHVRLLDDEYILPTHCYYCKETKKRGCCFIIRGHPNQQKVWTSSTSHKIELSEKYNQMIDYLKLL